LNSKGIPTGMRADSPNPSVAPNGAADPEVGMAAVTAATSTRQPTMKAIDRSWRRNARPTPASAAR